MENSSEILGGVPCGEMTTTEKVENNLLCSKTSIHERFRKTFGTIFNVIELAVDDENKATSAKELVGAELLKTEEDCKDMIMHFFSTSGETS